MQKMMKKYRKKQQNISYNIMWETMKFIRS